MLDLGKGLVLLDQILTKINYEFLRTTPSIIKSIVLNVTCDFATIQLQWIEINVNKSHAFCLQYVELINNAWSKLFINYMIAIINMYLAPNMYNSTYYQWLMSLGPSYDQYARITPNQICFHEIFLYRQYDPHGLRLGSLDFLYLFFLTSFSLSGVLLQYNKGCITEHHSIEHKIALMSWIKARCVILLQVYHQFTPMNDTIQNTALSPLIWGRFE